MPDSAILRAEQRAFTLVDALCLGGTGGIRTLAFHQPQVRSRPARHPWSPLRRHERNDTLTDSSRLARREPGC